MRFLGLDYGMKRIGIAVSDEEGRLAFPQKTIFNDSNTYKRIGESIQNLGIEEIVVGESLDSKNRPNALLAQIEVFIHELEKRFNLPVHKQKEFLTTVEARKVVDLKAEKNQSNNKRKVLNKKKEYNDASAAALILQRYLDRVNKIKHSGGSQDIV
jgi:putative Holliday junction resolvase